MTRLNRIGVLGAGAWGTALAITAKEAGAEVNIWSHEQDVALSLSAGDGNPVYLPGIDVPALKTDTDMRCLADSEAILAVVPAQFARGTFELLQPHVRAGTPILLCAKGIEQSTLKLMTDVLQETIPEATPAVLSGPSFAADVARHLPTAVTLACKDETLGQTLMQSIGRPSFRPYWSGDVVGAEIGGAVKNVLAIACGVVDGLALGKSAHAALIARGFAEMTRLAEAMGGQAETVSGLCGLGDLVLTCSSPQSRNMSFGQALGRGRAPEDILSERAAVTEGVATAPALIALADRHSVDMPICRAVAAILSGQQNLEAAVKDLLSRPFKGE